MMPLKIPGSLKKIYLGHLFCCSSIKGNMVYDGYILVCALVLGL